MVRLSNACDYFVAEMREWPYHEAMQSCSKGASNCAVARSLAETWTEISRCVPEKIGRRRWRQLNNDVYIFHSRSTADIHQRFDDAKMAVELQEEIP